MNYEYRVVFSNGRTKTVIVFAHLDRRAEEKINKYYPNATHVLVRTSKYLN